MDPKIAAALNNANAHTGHARNDFRTEEAKHYTHWMEVYARDYIPANGLLIDLGCAGGKQTFQAEQMGARVVGLDCALEALRLARQVADDTGSRAGFMRGDYALLPLADGSLDAALFPKNLVECSYAEADRLAAEIARVLKPGGRLILTLPDVLQKTAAHNQFLARYDAITGRTADRVEIPGQGAFDYPCYFWTCAYAVHTFSRCLKPVSVSQIDHALYMIVMEKEEER